LGPFGGYERASLDPAVSSNASNASLTDSSSSTTATTFGSFADATLPNGKPCRKESAIILWYRAGMEQFVSKEARKVCNSSGSEKNPAISHLPTDTGVSINTFV
jgi:hypothetical protein